MNSDDLNFAYKVRHALNEQLDHLPASTVDRLASARKIAVSRKKSQPVAVRLLQRAFAGGGNSSSQVSLLNKMGVAIPLLAMVIGLAGIYQVEEEQRIADIAELDAAVLSDELPLTAYMDEGFNAYLAQRAQ
jgi:hypothetical protein